MLNKFVEIDLLQRFTIVSSTVYSQLINKNVSKILKVIFKVINIFNEN